MSTAAQLRDRRLSINEDNGHFYSYLTSDDVSAESLRALVDLYTTDTQVGQILFCVNLQKALFDSQAWQPLFDGYDPEALGAQDMFAWLPPHQRRLDTCNQGVRQVHNLWSMAQRGLDHLAIWLARCRQRGVEGWLTVRMNDCHWAHEPRSHWHSEFGKAKAGLRIVKHRGGYRWHESSLDYSHADVRAHYLRLIRELFHRYDMDGLELDWMRFGHCLPYGHAKARRSILTEFLAEVGDLSRICSTRTRRPLRIGVRVPPDIETCLSLGYDVPEWIDRGQIAQVTISNFYADHWLDFPVDTWKAVVGRRPVALAVCLHAELTDPNTMNPLPDTPDIYRGAAGSALAKGADRICLFNTCYLADLADGASGGADGEGHYARHEQHPRDAELREILSTCGQWDTIAAHPRRHVLTFQQFGAPGDPDRRKIPVSLKPSELDLCSHIGPLVVFRFNIGPGPSPAEAARIHLGFAGTGPAAQARAALAASALWVNGQRCSALAPANACRPAHATDVAEFFVSWVAPAGAVHTGENVVEFGPPEMDGQVVWAELDIRSADAWSVCK